MSYIKKFVKKYQLFIYLNDKVKEIYYRCFISDKKLINKRFQRRLGRNVNLDNPVRYNDKLQWLKLYWHDPVATQCADKYEVRKFVENTIGKVYLNDLLGVYNSVDEIDLDKLPRSFVLKGTHGSGYNIICKDKRQMDWVKEFKKMRRWLRNNYYWEKREWVYKDIKPRIVCEKYLADYSGKPPMDYKIFCFEGEPKLIQVDVDRFGEHKQNFYNTDWTFKNIEIEYPADKTVMVRKPPSLEKMLELSKKLTNSFPHARADFYNINGKIIFGEITFFHHSGMGKFSPPEFEKEMGDYLRLPEGS